MPVHIIPQPSYIEAHEGVYRANGQVLVDGGGFINEAGVFEEQNDTAFPGLPIVSVETCLTEGKPARIYHRPTGLGPESYRMTVEQWGVTIEANDGAGAYHALQTLRQLWLSRGPDGAIPCVGIEDKPAYPWRGYMLDTSRHFYSAASIKRLIDLISMHHINVFHWHLTDDQGWRLPVPEYPRLTEVGSRRTELTNNREHGGFYTEDEIRDVVAFAAARHVEVVPEVDIPGHTSALLAAYPEFGCKAVGYNVGAKHGIYEDVLCAGNEKIFEIVDAVFNTLVRLFPSAYVHMGGDEVPVTRWEKCPKCRALMEAKGMTKPGELQGYLSQRFAKMLTDKGKIPIGWDEVLEAPGLPDEVVIMSWRGSAGGVKAANAGRKVIMTPNTAGCYLDYKHIPAWEEPGNLGVNTVEQAFRLDPAAGIDEPHRGLVLGGQGNLWSEMILADRWAEYMTFPRICALAESFWTAAPGERDLADFEARLATHLKRLDALKALHYDGRLTRDPEAMIHRRPRA